MPLVTLVMASGPGFPFGSPEHRYELDVVLTGDRQLDEAAWRADPGAWQARRVWPDDAPRAVQMHHDPDSGWSLRFLPRPGEAADAAPQAVICHASQIRPGEYVTIREPDGQEFGWRIVGVA